MFTERMKKIELLVLKREMDDVLQFLGFAGCVQLIAEKGEREPAPDEREIADLKGKVESTARFLGITGGGKGRGARRIGREEIVTESNRLIGELRGMMEEESGLLQQKLSLKQTADELSAFANLKVAFSDLEHLTYLTFRLGTIVPERMEELQRLLEKRALIVPLQKPGFIMAIAPKKGRFALDSELKKIAFQEAKFPADLKGIPSDVLPSVQRSIQEVEEALSRLEARKAEYRANCQELVEALLYNLDLDASIDAVKQSLESTGSVQRITGWIPRRRFSEVIKGLSELTHGRIAVRVFEPEEIPEVRSGKVKVPVVVSHGPIVRSFERMVFSYSVPLYGTIDPTPFVAVIFVLLFAIMFGDVGQGFLGLVIGLLIKSGWVKSFETYRKKSFGTIFVIVGIASMISGFIYGSFFANEEFLVPLTRAFTGLFGPPVDHILKIEGMSKIFAFFGFTIGVGALINTLGLVINIINQVKLRNWEKAFLTKTGLAGAVFFWYILFIAVRIVLGGKFQWFDLVALAVPLLVLFFREPLAHLITRRRPLLKEGMMSFIMEGIVEMLESATYYVSNSVSFLRVAAFALAHTVLSVIIFTLSDLVGSLPAQIIVVLIGNAIIIVLEGLIVTIQVIRRQYYEFFSKFFTESGEEFRPFTLHTTGGQ